MTHIPNIERVPERHGKMWALCGNSVSLRKGTNVFAGCPACVERDEYSPLNDPQTIAGSVDAWIDRSAWLRAHRVFRRRRNRP